MITTLNFRTEDLRFFNSATKYPSIPTLHALGDRGVPTDNVQVDFSGCTVAVTEKVDGTNGRLLLSGDSFAIGSREHLLTVNGDVLFDPAQDIVAATRAIAERVIEGSWDRFHVVYGEVYGGKVTATSKQYTTNRDSMHWRVFDVSVFDPRDVQRMRSMSTDELAAWRDGPRPDFLGLQEQRALCEKLGLDSVPLLRSCEPPPTDRRTVLEWLNDTIPSSLARIDATGDGKPEGVIVRTLDRSRIAKVRFDDYRKVK